MPLRASPIALSLAAYVPTHPAAPLPVRVFIHPSLLSVAASPLLTLLLMSTFVHCDPDHVLDLIEADEADLRDPSLRMSRTERDETRANIVRLQAVLREAYAFRSKHPVAGVSSLIPLPTNS